MKMVNVGDLGEKAARQMQTHQTRPWILAKRVQEPDGTNLVKMYA
jgi:hypothetical protein